MSVKNPKLYDESHLLRGLEAISSVCKTDIQLGKLPKEPRVASCWDECPAGHDIPGEELELTTGVGCCCLSLDEHAS